jgi:hypothetical protein
LEVRESGPTPDTGPFWRENQAEKPMLSVGTRFLVNILGRALPLAVAFLFALYSPNDFAKEIVFLCAILIVIVVEYLGVYRPSKDFEDTIREVFDYYFEPFVNEASFNGMAAQIRVNVMLVRWTLRGRYFFQYYQRGMAGHPDANLNFSIKRGLCGHAFRKNSNELIYRDLSNDTAEAARRKFNWPEDQFYITQHVKAVAAIPIYRERKTLRGHMKHKYFGVLNVDALNDPGVELLADPGVQKQIEGFAGLVQIILR